MVRAATTHGRPPLACRSRPAAIATPLPRPLVPPPQVTVDRPDVQGRVAILKVHSRGKALGKDVDLEKIARRTPGFTGAWSVCAFWGNWARAAP